MQTHPKPSTLDQRPPRAAAWLRRIAPALGIFVMAPLTAEYLTGYDTSTGNIGALLQGLIVLAPLYGGAALLVRETARRFGLGWPSMVLLALAFGVGQAGLVDHSLFNTSYRDIPYWESELRPTFLPTLGISANNTLIFLSGHVIWSIAIPIAILESFVPRHSSTPWLGNFGLATVAALYLLFSALILTEHVRTEQFLPSPAQLIGASAIVVASIIAAFVLGKTPYPSLPRPVPRPWLLGALAWLLLSTPTLIELVFGIFNKPVQFAASWGGVALYALLLAVLAASITYWSRSEHWSPVHRLAVAGGALLTNAWIAFLVEPLGDVPLAAKLAHNIAFALGAVLLLALAARTSIRE